MLNAVSAAARVGVEFPATTIRLGCSTVATRSILSIAVVVAVTGLSDWTPKR